MANHKYGRRPPTNAPALKLSSFLKSTQIPDHPVTADYGQEITDWQMLGNDQYGDCVAVCYANNRYLVTKYLGDKAVYPTQDQVFEFYKTQNPNFPSEDNGMVIQDALDYLHKNGSPDGGKLVAYAKVDITNEEEVKAAAAIFGGLWFGITVSQANEDEFDANQAWDHVKRSPILGGHGIAGVGYNPQVRFVTWAEETEFTDAFMKSAQMEECWVAIWEEHLGSKAFEQGVNLDQLAADYQALTGNVLPLPTPTPTPEPTPTPTPTPDPGAAPFPEADPVVAEHIEAAAGKAKLSDSDWLNHHFKTYFKIK